MKTHEHARSRATLAATLTIAWVAAGALAGCATMPPEIPFVPDANPDRASVTVFRERQFLNSRFDTMLRVDRKTVGVLKNGDLLVANAAPGDLKIAIQSEYDIRELVLPLHAESGHDYYVDVLPRSVYLDRYAGGAISLPKDKADGVNCNIKWCISLMSAEEAKSRAPKTAP